MPQLGYDRYYAEIEAQTALIAAALPDVDPAAPVPTCPEWTYEYLIRHVGRAHRWAAVMVERRTAVPVPQKETPDRELPDGPAAQADWLVAGAARLAAAVREAGPDTPVWSWSRHHGAGMWIRRMVHETVVHRADVDLGVGRRYEVDADLAVDGITELLELLPEPSLIEYRPVLGELRGDGQTLHFHATDEPSGEWLVRRTPDGVTFEPGHGRGDVAVRGTARDLLLVLYGRIPPDRVEVLGDADLFAHWLKRATL
jgi:uncharacterized protein (TIGR03083 family)